jgi:chemotaxis protein methyltransferase CheR
MAVPKSGRPHPAASAEDAPSVPVSAAGSETEYRRFCDLLDRLSGISLGENKRYLVDSRLGALIAELGVSGLGEFVTRLEADLSGRLRRRVVDAMTTNETQWFRDAHPFTALAERILPELAGRGMGPLRIWSAGCSSGQEPYSIAMVAEEMRFLRPGSLIRPLEVVATDISPSVLTAARAGVYDELAVTRGLSEERRRRFFQHAAEGWEVREEVRRSVQFREMSLLDTFAPLGRFDAIFCRNVLIYFSRSRKQDILTRMAATLSPGGFLLLGASESLSALADRFEMVRHGGAVLYRLRA